MYNLLRDIDKIGQRNDMIRAIRDDDIGFTEYLREIKKKKFVQQVHKNINKERK